MSTLPLDRVGRVRLYLSALGLWRRYWPVDASLIIANGDGALDGPADAAEDLSSYTHPSRRTP